MPYLQLFCIKRINVNKALSYKKFIFEKQIKMKNYFVNQIKKCVFELFKIFSEKDIRKKQYFYLIYLYTGLFYMKKYIFFVLETDLYKYSQHQKKSWKIKI